MIAEQERNERLAERQRKLDAGEPIDDEDEAAEKGFFSRLICRFMVSFFF